MSKPMLYMDGETFNLLVKGFIQSYTVRNVRYQKPREADNHKGELICDLISNDVYEKDFLEAYTVAMIDDLARQAEEL